MFTVDTTAVTFLTLDQPRAETDFDTKAPKLDREGRQVFSLVVMAIAPGFKPSQIKVKMSTDPGPLAAGEKVVFPALIAQPGSWPGDKGATASRANYLAPKGVKAA